MKLSSFSKIIDFFSFVALLIMISTGALLEFTLPVRSRHASVWGMTRHEWGDIHSYASLLFLALMAIHLFTHLKYIKNAIAGKASREQNYKIAMGIVCLITLIALAIAPVITPVNEESGVRPRHGRW